MTNYLKMNNYYKFYSKTVIVTTAIMDNNSKLPDYADFTHEIFPWLTNQNQEHSCVMLEYMFNSFLYFNNTFLLGSTATNLQI